MAKRFQCCISILNNKSYFRSRKPKCRTWREDWNCSNPKNILQMFNSGRKKICLQIVKDRMSGTGCWQVKHFVMYFGLFSWDFATLQSSALKHFDIFLPLTTNQMPWKMEGGVSTVAWFVIKPQVQLAINSHSAMIIANLCFLWFYRSFSTFCC